MADRAILILQEGPGTARQQWPLDEQVTAIGRWEGSDVLLPDREVSRRHAQIRHDAGQYVLVDLGSKNGTLVNGVRAERATVLQDGDEIQIAPRYRLLFVDSEATAPSTSKPKGIHIDAVTRSASVGGRALDPPLAPLQFALLQLLASQPGRVFTRDEISAACYVDEEGAASDQAIDGLVRRLRARLAEADPEGQHIAAVRGHGYRLAP
jgi:DNA-binding response OmpR family regulator